MSQQDREKIIQAIIDNQAAMGKERVTIFSCSRQMGKTTAMNAIKYIHCNTKFNGQQDYKEHKCSSST